MRCMALAHWSGLYMFSLHPDFTVSSSQDVDSLLIELVFDSYAIQDSRFFLILFSFLVLSFPVPTYLP